jgi:diguanylate cyclase (GGDEF)-like protein
MRLRRARPTAQPAGRLRRGLLPGAAVGLGMLWACVVAVAAAGVQGTPLLVLSGVAVLATAVLLPLAHRHQAKLPSLAATDALTGLANHRGFHEVLAAELERARRVEGSVALVMLDLDNFKAVNDTHGHPYGDQVLTAVGKKLAGVLRATDTAARVGGEEFALILPDTDGELAYRIAERTRKTVEDVSAKDMELSCSAGIAIYPADAEDASSLCQRANGALYWAKRRGNKHTRRFDPGHVALAWTDRQAAEIAALLAEPEAIKSVFQPVVDLASGHLVGYEALARFSPSPGRAPAAWFAQAYGCGLGPELDAAAIRAALEPVGRPIETHLALNISPSALSSEAVAEALPSDLEGLVIEITEHEFVPDDETLTGAIRELRNRGARIAIDDAGAGYSGLKQMMRVGPDIVKLDRDLIKRIHADPARMALVESFVRFAGRIGATVCAEGIESLDDLAVISDLDVQWGQGFVLGRPAEPWALVSPVAAGVCRSALAEALRSGSAGDGQRITAGDRRLEHLSARLASARSRTDLEGALALIAAELNAEMVCLSHWHPEEGVIETLAQSGGTGEERFPLGDYPLTARVLRDQEAVQVLVGDPEADRREVELLLTLGHRSLLIVPVVSRGESLGIVEAYGDAERPWTRTEINRARIISNQFGSVILALFRSRAALAD